MADINQSTWSETDASNNSASPAGFPEAMAPSGVNDSARALMGAVRRWRDRIGPTVTSGGAANAQTLTYPVATTAFVVGDVFVFKAGFTNTGATTLSVDGSAATQVVTADNAPLAQREIQLNKTHRVYYDGTNFVLDGIGTQKIDTGESSVTLSGGIIVKFGKTTMTAVNATVVNFATPFPNLTLAGFVCPTAPAGSNFEAFVGLSPINVTQLVITLSSVQTVDVFWLVIGF